MQIESTYQFTNLHGLRLRKNRKLDKTNIGHKKSLIARNSTLNNINNQKKLLKINDQLDQPEENLFKNYQNFLQKNKLLNHSKVILENFENDSQQLNVKKYIENKINNQNSSVLHSYFEPNFKHLKGIDLLRKSIKKDWPNILNNNTILIESNNSISKKRSRSDQLPNQHFNNSQQIKKSKIKNEKNDSIQNNSKINLIYRDIKKQNKKLLMLLEKFDTKIDKNTSIVLQQQIDILNLKIINNMKLLSENLETVFNINYFKNYSEINNYNQNFSDKQYT